METTKNSVRATIPLAALTRRMSLILICVLLASNAVTAVLALRAETNTQLLLISDGVILPIETGAYANEVEQMTILKDFVATAYTLGTDPQNSKSRLGKLVASRLLQAKQNDLADVFDRAAAEQLKQTVSMQELRIMEPNKWQATLELTITRRSEKAARVRVEVRIQMEKRERSIQNWRAWEISGYDETILR